MVQWLRLSAANAGGMGFDSGQGSKIPHAKWPKRLKYIYIYTSEARRECTEAVNGEEARGEVLGDRLGGRRSGRGENGPVLPPRLRFNLWLIPHGHLIYAAVHRLPLIAASGGYRWLPCVQVSRCGGFSCCRAQALGTAGFSSCGTQALAAL